MELWVSDHRTPAIQDFPSVLTLSSKGLRQLRRWSSLSCAMEILVLQQTVENISLVSYLILSRATNLVKLPGQQQMYSYQRLTQIKGIYDPHNVFAYPQSITD